MERGMVKMNLFILTLSIMFMFGWLLVVILDGPKWFKFSAGIICLVVINRLLDMGFPVI